MRFREFSVLASLTCVSIAGCVREPVDWGDVSYRASQLGDPDTRSAILSAQLPAVSGAAAPCILSIRTAAASHEVFRVWWSARHDSSVILSVQRSDDRGTSWKSPVTVDARDRGSRGCQRPAPAVFYDATSDYLHIVYFVEAADGKGLFFAHSMDRGATFHSPVPVVYGNAPVNSSVAAHGDSVVVVFEDPNAVTPRIGIVLSHTAGHIFEQRGQVTPDDAPAVRPWVQLDHRVINVWWKVATAEGTPGTGERVGYRSGTWR